MYKAIIADDHPLIRLTLRNILCERGFDIVAEAENGAEALQLARLHVPTIMVLDISMPKMGGLEVITRIGMMDLPIKILVFTSQAAEIYSLRCMKAGAAGFVSKTSHLDELVRAISAVMDGYSFFPNLSASSVRSSDIHVSDADLIKSLSDRELSIIQMLASGLGNKEIGTALLISNKTVSAYKVKLIEKLKVKSVIYLADFAKRNNLI
ncbi:response regulator transcription factor [Pseudomonas chlororaphis]|uniref:response regulator transcription factor n=1 Tax=Pseudomonas chlororaphis TaxID=587753 RepID=UPI0006A631A5|nr:response regulator transcription factor [Pseudomonas chlororaphis]AZC31145.1 DNA-binding response regulator, LuxR family [Pseudomonas chlororaphis subsp. piscium]WDG78201.1 response regulator transcription factor [Pseudomonas chlororaphis]WDG82564.1 response regulator transcription factor [Pseudomonas chlororaphis]WDG88948.1 response regulator transcription factor [Pseudomonas chlororaphis]SDS99661.1 two component transcriptional regulator, LuxR family [Pseudomonas chlororaphis]